MIEISDKHLFRLTQWILVDFMMWVKNLEREFTFADLRSFCVHWLMQNVKNFDASKIACEGVDNFKTPDCP
jgi:hypothetical protein